MLDADLRLEVAAALRGAELFENLDETGLDAILAAGSVAKYRRGAILFQKMDPGDSMMLVLAGTLKISSVSMDGKEAVISFLSTGEILGEIAVLDGGPRTADATVVEPVELFVLKRSAILPILENYPCFSINVIEMLCSRLRRTNEMVEANVQLPMAARVARGILRLLHAYGKRVPAGYLIELKINQREFGGYVGLARENVNRQLSTFREQGLITLERGYITVLNRDALYTVAEEEGV